MKKLTLIIFIFLFNIAIEPDLFDTNFLTKDPFVRDFLIEYEHFQPVQFSSLDNINLSGLLKEDSDASFNIIFCAGFYPGRKEGMATFIRLVPETTNILFFDSRGHGQSNGAFFSALHTYGLHEYQDIIAAIEFIHDNNNKPIIIIGLCAGAFHASRALIELTNKNKLNALNIAGFVFDSGLVSLLDVLHIPEHHFKESVIPWFFKNNLYRKDSKLEVKSRNLVRLSTWFLSKIIKSITLSIKPFYLWNEEKTTIYPQFARIKCPILFIHSYDDTYCNIEQIQTLAQITKNESHWWIKKPAKHACHHLKHTAQYRDRLLAFFSETVNT